MVGTSGIAVWAEGIKADLQQRLPGQRKTQRDKLSLLVATMLHVRSANLVELASGLPRPSDRWDMGYQWISRFLANDLVSCDAVMQPFAGEILARLAGTGGPVPLILDQSKVSDRHQVLMLSVRWGERALPVAWRVEETDGAIGFAVQKDLLDAVRGWLPAEARVTLHGDRFYGTPDLIRWCQDCGSDYRLRLKGNLQAWIGSRKATTGDLALSGAHYFENVALTAKRVSTNIGIIHDAGHAEPWIVAMSAEPSYLSTLEYSRRWGIEPMFSDFKSRGFGIQDTQIQYPDRLGRLILVMSLALYWAVSTGMWDAAENPTPNEKKFGAAAQKARQKQAVLVHPRPPHSCQTYAPSPATAKALGLPAKLMDGEAGSYDRLMVTSCVERKSATFSLGFSDAGILGYVSVIPGPGLVRLYRFRGGSQHVYRQDEGPLKVSFIEEPNLIYIDAIKQPGTIGLFELWFSGKDRHRELIISEKPKSELERTGVEVTQLGYI